MSRQVYTVQKGDTLWGIGKHHNLSVQQLAEWNHIYGKKIHQLSIGQKIFLQPEEYDSYDTVLTIKLLDINFRPINKATLMVEYDEQCKTISVNNSQTDDILIKDRHRGIKVFFLNLNKQFVLIAHHTVLPMGKKRLTLTSRMMKVSGNNLPQQGRQVEKLKALAKRMEKQNRQTPPPEGGKLNKKPYKTPTQHNEVMRTDAGRPTQVISQFYNEENLRLHEDNEIYRQIILKIARRHGYSAPTVAAIINAEAAKEKNSSRWKADSQNSRTSAGGLTQFLDATWKEIAKNKDSLLYQHLQVHPNTSEAALLKLKYKPELAIDAAIVYAKQNIKGLERKGLPIASVTNNADLAKLAYFTHHEGVNGAHRLITNKYTSSSAMSKKLQTQIGPGNTYQKYMREAGQNGVKAYHAWIRDYVDEHINVKNFMHEVPDDYCVNSLDAIIVQLGGTSYRSKNKDTCPIDSISSNSNSNTIKSSNSRPITSPTPAKPTNTDTSETTRVGGDGNWRNPLDYCQVRRFGYRSLPLSKDSSNYSKHNLREATHKASRFGKTTYRSAGKHQGIDLEAEPNTPIYPVCVGTIVFARLYGSGKSYGKAVILKCNVDDLPQAKQDILKNKLNFTKDIIYFVYCHLNRIDVREKDIISDLNNPIGLTGNSGNASSMTSITKGAHLHFEVRDEITKSLGRSGLNYRYPPFPLLDNCYTTENGVK